MYHRMLLSLTGKPAGASYRLLAIKAGMLRHILAFTAGVLLIREAEFDPSRFCVGFLIVAIVYRITVIRDKGYLKEAKAQ